MASRQSPPYYAARNVDVHESARGTGGVSVNAEHVVPIMARGTSVKISIPLDKQNGLSSADDDISAAVQTARRRRDSLERREALLKGREGSRRRQRWENDRLLNNPWAQPPLPNDWKVTPTHPVRVVPYFLAPLWDEKIAARRQAEREQYLQKRSQSSDQDSSRVARELRARLKRTRAAKGLLHDLEEEVRQFLSTWEQEKHSSAISDHSESEDDIVFVGRNGQLRNEPPSPKAISRHEDMVVLEDILAERLVYGSLVDEEGSGFARWLVHSIAEYYGLHTWSVTRGSPERRDAYVGIDRALSQRGALIDRRMLTPLWGLV